MLALALALALVAAACGEASSETSSGTTGGLFAGRTPEHHRGAPEECAAARPAVNASIPGGTCAADADCAEGENGRCVYTFSEPSTVCSYDACAADSDCGGAQVCDCRNEASYNANTCFHGNCQLDADCGAGGFCSPSAVLVASNCTTTIDPGSFGYFCHTPSDECLDDSDCPEPSPSACVFTVEKMRWACVALECVK